MTSLRFPGKVWREAPGPCEHEAILICGTSTLCNPLTVLCMATYLPLAIFFSSFIAWNKSQISVFAGYFGLIFCTFLWKWSFWISITYTRMSKYNFLLICWITWVYEHPPLPTPVHPVPCISGWHWWRGIHKFISNIARDPHPYKEILKHRGVTNTIASANLVNQLIECNILPDWDSTGCWGSGLAAQREGFFLIFPDFSITWGCLSISNWKYFIARAVQHWQKSLPPQVWQWQKWERRVTNWFTSPEVGFGFLIFF